MSQGPVGPVREYLFHLGVVAVVWPVARANDGGAITVSDCLTVCLVSRLACASAGLVNGERSAVRFRRGSKRSRTTGGPMIRVRPCVAYERQRRMSWLARSSRSGAMRLGCGSEATGSGALPGRVSRPAV
jgi:hypothetical protein